MIKNKTMGTLERKERRSFYKYISPWLIGFFGLTIGPMIYSFYCALCNWDAITPPVFIGLDNYIKAFTGNQLFWDAVINTISYSVFSVPSSMFMALLLALLLNRNFRLSGLFQALFYFPAVASGTAVFMVWTWLYNAETGVFNYLLSLVGIEGPDWLTSTEWAMPSIILMNLTFCGQTMLIFLAGLKQIPLAYYEAANIDGAGSWTKFIRITIPMISPILLLNTIMGLIAGFQVFGQPFILTNGGPVNATYVYGLLIYDTGFRYYRFGEAAALSWILCAVLVLVTLAVMKITKNKIVYDS